MLRHASHPISGFARPAFEPVRKAFADNFVRRRELGGACAAYFHGEPVVDIWGGVRNKETGEAWDHDTMVIVHSATKGLAAMTLAIAHSRGWLDYEERVSTYWPEFAQQGKERITVRQLLAHQAGLFAIDEPVDRRDVADLDRLAVILARQKPAWEPGTRQAYHAITLGFYEGELLRRIDPQHRSLGRFFQDEIATPLGLDAYIRVPPEIPNERLATISPPGRLEMLLKFPPRLTLDAMNHKSKMYRSLIVNPGSTVYMDTQCIYARNLEVPSGGAVTTARALARVYGVFAMGGPELGLRRETLDLLSAPAVPPARGFYDECLRGEVQFSLGFMKPSPSWPFGSASSFGSPGAGGSLGYADPSAGVGYGYVTSQMGTSLTGDPRDVALRSALDAAVSRFTGGTRQLVA
jgi:CubicO group peptidase (beta-lactamase class C family)